MKLQSLSLSLEELLFFLHNLHEYQRLGKQKINSNCLWQAECRQVSFVQLCSTCFSLVLSTHIAATTPKPC